MVENKKMETTTAFFYVESDILYMRIKKDAEIGVEESKEGIAIRLKIQQGRKMLMLVDSREVGLVTRDAREYASEKKIDEMNIAMAVLTGTSLSATIIGNFFIKFNKPKTPTRLFKSEEKAVEWLNTFR